MDQLTFNFSAIEYNGWPRARIIVNNITVHDFIIETPAASVSIDLDYVDGVHNLQIQRYGKTDNNVLFVDGKILQDQSITLNSIYYNNVKLADNFLYRSKFCWNGQEYPSTLTWGPNGVWHWEFGIPFVQWAVDSSEHLIHPDLITPHKSNANELKDKIKNLRSVWQ
jgi:hypothetical protein